MISPKTLAAFSDWPTSSSRFAFFCALATVLTPKARQSTATVVSIDLLFILFFPVNASSRGRWSCGTTNNTVSGRGESGCALTH